MAPTSLNLGPVPSMMPGRFADQFPTPETETDDPFLAQTGTLDTRYTPQPLDEQERVETTQKRHVLAPQAPESSLAGLSPELAELLSTSKSYRMSEDEVSVAKFLHSKGYSLREIGRLMDRTHVSVNRAVRREDARQCLSRNQRKLAMHWVQASSVAAKKGHHEPAQAALEAIGAVDVPQAAGAHGAVQVNVGVALPGAGAPTVGHTE